MSKVNNSKEVSVSTPQAVTNLALIFIAVICVFGTLLHMTYYDTRMRLLEHRVYELEKGKALGRDYNWPVRLKPVDPAPPTIREDY